MIWTIIDGELCISGLGKPSEIPPAEVTPWMWQIDPMYADGMPFTAKMGFPMASGAFMDSANLSRIRIPETVKRIGILAFAGTALTEVKIAADCEYFPTSFPENCTVLRYGEGGEFVQLCDKNGRALLDKTGARIYVRRRKNG